MTNFNTLRRLAPGVLTLGIGSALLAGCGRTEAASSEACSDGVVYAAVVKDSVSQSLHEVLTINGHQLNDMLNMNETAGEIDSSLVKLHQNATHHYDSVLPEDTFQVCVTGNEVTAGLKYSIVDK
ncbi:MAG: hypothetical protein ABI602_04325 [Candidatus Saccharibacteria bacterium]